MSGLERLPGFRTEADALAAADTVTNRILAQVPNYHGQLRRIDLAENPTGGFMVTCRFERGSPVKLGHGLAHRYFTVGPVHVPRSKIEGGPIGSPAMAIFYSPRPQPDFEAGSISLGMTFPALIAGHMENPREILAEIAGILNEHWKEKEQ